MSKSNKSQRYELTADDVLKMYNLSPSKYIAEKDRSLAAINGGSDRNIQPYQWVIYKKVNGRKGERVNIDTSKIPVSPGYNEYARSTENGVVINRQTNISAIMNVSGQTERIGPSADLMDNSQSSETFTETESTSSTFKITRYDGHDEEVVKHMMFAKLQLLKECYESVGELF